MGEDPQRKIGEKMIQYNIDDNMTVGQKMQQFNDNDNDNTATTMMIPIQH